MSLDKRVFLREMALLAELFRRPDLSDPLMARYYEFLNSNLTTAEFERAAQKILTEDTYWPPPVRFLRAAKGDPARQAREEWDALVEGAARNELAELSETGKRALRALGGWATVAYADQARLPSLRRAFLESHGDASAEPQERPAVLELEDEP